MEKNIIKSRIPDITSGENIPIILLRLSIPIMLGFLFQTFYNIVDAFFLGKLGRAAFSAPTIAFNVIFVLIAFGIGFSTAGTTLIAQAKGMNNQEKVDFYLGQIAITIFILSIVISIIGIVFTNPILILLKTPSDAFVYTSRYMKIIFTGIPFMFGMMLFQASLQGIGDTITPLWVQGIAVGLNVILDPLLIFGIGHFPKMGVSGAAIATVISRSVGSFISIYILIRGKKGIRLRIKHLIPDKKALKLIFDIGLPTSIGQSIAALGFTALQGIVNYFGSAVVAAFGIGNRIVSLFNMPAIGFSKGVTTMVGQNLGAKKIRRVWKSVRAGVIMIGGFLVVGMTLTFFYGNSFVHFFIPNDPVVTKWGVMLFKIISPSVVFFGILMVINGAFQGAGDTKPPMILNIVRLWGIRVPLAYLLAITFHFGPVGIWFSMFLSNIIVSIWGAFWFKKGNWRNKLSPDRI